MHKTPFLAAALALATFIAAHGPARADLEHQVVLRITIVTPRNMPDVEKTVPMASLASCWASAAEFVSQDIEQVRKKHPQALGVAAGCGVLERPSVRN